LDIFLRHLKNIKYPVKKQKQKELWDISGILKNRSNEVLKFDLRPLKNNCKNGSFNTKADKMVFDIENQYIIVDIKELHTYIKQHKLKKVLLEELIFNLDWNTILQK
jgi:hypothetical protein